MSAMNKAAMALLLATSASAIAADAGTAAGAKAQYDAERARCTSGATGQDQASCLRSASAAYDAIRGNRMQDANTAFDANAMARCTNLPTADRADCETRVKGEGTKSGSVAGGGEFKETVTVIPPTRQ